MFPHTHQGKCGLVGAFFGILFRETVAPMSETNATVRQASDISPQGLRLEDLARILSAMGPKPVTVEMLQADIDDGAPVNRDGTLNLIHYMAWLLREGTGAGD